MTGKIIILGFLQNRKPKEFWKAITQSWFELTPVDKSRIFNFLFQSGQWTLFAKLFVFAFEDPDMDRPWLQFLTILERQGLFVPAPQFGFIKNVLQVLEVPTQDAKSLSDLIDSLKAKKKFKFLEGLQNRKQELLRSARIAKSERLLDQQMNLLHELKKLFPHDVNVQQNVNQRKITDAEKVLAKSRSLPPPLSPEKLKEKAENEAFIEDLTLQAKQLDTGEPRKKLDIAIMLSQMGYPKKSLEILEHSELPLSSAWHLCDFLLSSKQYLSLLSHCEQMRSKLVGSPDSLFAISYFEALTFWELGEHARALEIMKNISALKPQFRSASQLLASWREEVS